MSGPAAAGGEGGGLGTPAATARQALELLMEGNRRWVAGEPVHPRQSSERRAALAAAQSPFATVFCCLDSRVAPEIIFDCGIGDLAVIRTGAHVLDPAVVLPSLQFGTETLATPLVLVMGHQRCGAIKAALEALEGAAPAAQSMATIVQAVRPAYTAAVADPSPGRSDLAEQVVRVHTDLTVQALLADPVISRRVRAGQLEVLGAYYSLETGAVSALDGAHPTAAHGQPSDGISRS